ncbi:MAG TPA: HAMP domain-containing sensor histidine kinase, partial [Burkholderiaceae bacterium]|nr:HAMP domain-containing sensor histidine kinase [Burkholderiaceae bacterium]
GERDDALARLRAGIERANHLVGQLLALARAEPGSAPAHTQVDLVQVLRQAVADTQVSVQAVHGRIELQAPATLMLSGDAEALRSLLRNLIDNALKYGGPEPTVQVNAALDGLVALVRIDDAGPGIPEGERRRVFDRFYRREPGRGSGSGLGLTIARAVAQQHGGTVRLAGSPLGGLQVEVRLPAS